MSHARPRPGKRIPLVRMIALYMHRKMPRAELEDLEQAGWVGLLEAAARFHRRLGVTFAAASGARIRGAMVDSVRDGSWAPRSLARTFRDIARAKQTIEHREGRGARESEIAGYLKLTAEEYRKLCMDIARRHMLGIDKAAEYVASPYPQPDVVAEEDQIDRKVSAAIAALPERERVLVEMTFRDGVTLKRVGACLGITEGRASQIRSEALAKLRGMFG